MTVSAPDFSKRQPFFLSLKLEYKWPCVLQAVALVRKERWRRDRDISDEKTPLAGDRLRIAGAWHCHSLPFLDNEVPARRLRLFSHGSGLQLMSLAALQRGRWYRESKRTV